MAGLAALLTTSAAATALVADGWRDVTGTTEVIALGSGSALSVFVRTSRSRLLIAAGDDPNAFDRAYASVARPTAPRLDILISAGRGVEAAVADHVLRHRRPRLTMAIVPPATPGQDGALDGAGVTTIRRSIRMELHDGVGVDLEPDLDPAGDAWRIIIGRGASNILIVPALGEVEGASQSGLVAATVVVQAPRQVTADVPGSGHLVVAATPRGEVPFDGAQRVLDTDPDPADEARFAWVIGDGEAVAARFQAGQVAFERRGAWLLTSPSSP